MSNNETPGGQRVGWVLALVYIAGLYTTVYWHAIWALPGFEPFGRAVIAILVGDPDASQALAAFLAGLAGFLGVGATLWWNARQQRLQHQREIVYERERRIELDRRETTPAAIFIRSFAADALGIRFRLFKQKGDFYHRAEEWNELLGRHLSNYETEIVPRFAAMPSRLAYDTATNYSTLRKAGRINADIVSARDPDTQILASIYYRVATHAARLEWLERRVHDFVEGRARTDNLNDALPRLNALVEEERRQLKEQLDRRQQ